MDEASGSKLLVWVSFWTLQLCLWLQLPPTRSVMNRDWDQSLVTMGSVTRALVIIIASMMSSCINDNHNKQTSWINILRVISQKRKLNNNSFICSIKEGVLYVMFVCVILSWNPTQKSQAKGNDDIQGCVKAVKIFKIFSGWFMKNLIVSWVRHTVSSVFLSTTDEQRV